MASTLDIPLAHTLDKLSDNTSSTQPPLLIVFINGLMLPQKLWTPTITLLKPLLAQHLNPIFTLTYDRYGQGASRSASADWKPQLHDLSFASDELESVLAYILANQQPTLGPTAPILIFVSHSIGVPLARLHNHQTAHPAAAHLFLDSNISNTDFVSIFPNPDDPSFDPSILPSDATVDDLRLLRDRTQAMFHPSVPNPEGLDRSTVRDLVPYANAPKLRGSQTRAQERQGPWLTVVGHDPVTFADEGLRLQGTPMGLNRQFMQPAWDEYNKGLLELSDEGRVKGVVIAEGAGHFVQRDTPQVVAEQVVELVRKVSGTF